MMQSNLRDQVRKNQKLHKLYQQAYYLLLKRHFYGWTSPLRVLPDFIVIGVVRGGTTSMYDNLSKHPCIYRSAYDELGFFDSNFELGINWYKSLFPSIFQKKYAKFKKKHFLTYDVTPFYIWNPFAAERISKMLPNVKLITLFRNPVDRAYSNYYLGVRERTEQLSFEEAIKEELKALDNEKDSDSKDLSKYTRPRSYLAKGFYAKQIKIWLDLFPKQNILFLSSEEFSNNSQKTLSEIFRFLNLPDHKIKFERKNVGNYPEMKSETRKFLLDFFRPYNNEMFSLLGQDFGWNK